MAEVNVPFSVRRQFVEADKAVRLMRQKEGADRLECVWNAQAVKQLTNDVLDWNKNGEESFNAAAGALSTLYTLSQALDLGHGLEDVSNAHQLIQQTLAGNEEGRTFFNTIARLHEKRMNKTDAHIGTRHEMDAIKSALPVISAEEPPEPESLSTQLSMRNELYVEANGDLFAGPAN